MTAYIAPYSSSLSDWQRQVSAAVNPALQKLADVYDVKADGGATGDGSTDDTAAFKRAAASAKHVFLPAGTYCVSDTIAISLDGSCWSGTGVGSTIIQSTVANKAIFSINGYLNGTSIEEMKLTRSVTATAGGNGVECSTVSIGQAYFRRLLIEKQYRGLSLGPTDWSEIEKVIVQSCQSDGVYITNRSADGACQWSFDTVLAQENGGNGFVWVSIAGPAQMTIGTVKNCATFANTGHGLAFLGLSSVPIQDVRISIGFFGQDGNDEIYLDTYGDQHTITGVFTELAGTSATGPGLATAQSNVGCGITVTGNNAGVQVTGCHAYGHSYDGYYLNGQADFLSNCRSTNNGVAGLAGRQNGVKSTAGYVSLTGGYYGNTGANTSQHYGAYIADGNNLAVGFAVLTSNTTAAWGADTNINYVTSVGNLPNTLNVGLAPQGAVLIGGSGSFTPAGTLNAAAGIYKAGTAYTNP